jgi:hypothetical protein
MENRTEYSSNHSEQVTSGEEKAAGHQQSCVAEFISFSWGDLDPWGKQDWYFLEL